MRTLIILLPINRIEHDLCLFLDFGLIFFDFGLILFDFGLLFLISLFSIILLKSVDFIDLVHGLIILHLYGNGCPYAKRFQTN